MKEKKFWRYVFWILLAEAVGALSGWLTREGTRIFNETANKPVFMPPAIVFPIVWSILYALMGISTAMVSLHAKGDEKTDGISIFIAQLTVNFFWSLIFFNLRSYTFAFAWAVLLSALVIWMTVYYGKIYKPAGILQVPYVLWSGFAAFLAYWVMAMN